MIQTFKTYVQILFNLAIKTNFFSVHLGKKKNPWHGFVAQCKTLVGMNRIHGTLWTDTSHTAPGQQ